MRTLMALEPVHAHPAAEMVEEPQLNLPTVQRWQTGSHAYLHNTVVQKTGAGGKIPGQIPSEARSFLVLRGHGQPSLRGLAWGFNVRCPAILFAHHTRGVTGLR